MSHVSQRGLKQDVTIWNRIGNDGFGGDIVSAPVAAKGRWEDKTDLFYSPLDKKEVVSQAVVFLDRDVKVGDYIYLGTSASTTPWLLEGASKVRRFDKIPDLRNLHILRIAYL